MKRFLGEGQLVFLVVIALVAILSARSRTQPPQQVGDNVQGAVGTAGTAGTMIGSEPGTDAVRVLPVSRQLVAQSK